MFIERSWTSNTEVTLMLTDQMKDDLRKATWTWKKPPIAFTGLLGRTMESPLHYQPRLKVLSFHMIPVIEAKRHVAVLLNLEHHDVTAQRVNCPSREEDGVAGLRREADQVVRDRPVRERTSQIG
jgi:hypothetical protein